MFHGGTLMGSPPRGSSFPELNFFYDPVSGDGDDVDMSAPVVVFIE
jgi:hypothetical protein